MSSTCPASAGLFLLGRWLRAGQWHLPWNNLTARRLSEKPKAKPSKEDYPGRLDHRKCGGECQDNEPIHSDQLSAGDARDRLYAHGRRSGGSEYSVRETTVRPGLDVRTSSFRVRLSGSGLFE